MQKIKIGHRAKFRDKEKFFPQVLFPVRAILRRIFTFGVFRTLLLIKHLMTGPKGNSEFCFPETLNVPRGEAEGNIEQQH